MSMSPSQFIHRVTRALRRRLEPALRRWGCRSRLGRVVYYGIFNPAFDREMRAVLHGRSKFDLARSAEGSTRSLLRRNIHRLEKGLIMRPRRPVFALDYIEETVDFYLKSLSVPAAIRPCREELKWAHDVLHEYFLATGPHPLIDRLRKRITAGTVLAPPSEPPSTPYPRSLIAGRTIDYEALRTLAVQRRSVRWYQQRPVPRELIEKAIDVARLSPSACNRQPYFFHVFDSPEDVARVAALPAGAQGFAHGIPVIVAVIGELRNYYGERDRHVIYVDAAMAVMSLMFAVETLGLSSCCLNWPDLENQELAAAQVLRLSSDQRVICFISIGYADPEGQIPFSQKKPVSEIAKFGWRL